MMISFSSHFRYILQFTPLLLLLSGAQAQSAESVTVPLTIQGAAYTASLQENSALLGKLGGSVAGTVAKHYKGVLIGVDDSWVRASNINGQWQGVASLNGSLQIIENDALPSTSNKSANLAMTHLKGSPVINFADQLKSCGTSKVQDSTVELATILAAPPADAVTYSSLCATPVNGVCMFAELELIFDQAFQSEFGAQASAQAAALVNTAEGYYLNDMGMAFDTITMEMLSSDVFTTSTDSSAVLSDLANQKAGGQLAFLKNNRALTHLVTGRDFDGNIAGVAYLNQVCQSGASVGTSSVVGLGTERIALTALVVAHELGHNFGAAHDTLNNACSSGFIMAPSLGNVSNFSSCSITEMKNQIDNATTNTSPSLCFNFPADAGIVADNANPSSVIRDEAFARLYTVSVANGYQTATQIQLQGTVVDAGGVFSSVAANGNACTLADGSHSYLCTINNPGASIALSVQGIANGTADQVQLTHTVDIVDSDILDLNSSNDQLTEAIEFTDSASSTPPPSSNNTASSDSGDGGGSIDWWWLTSLVFLFSVRSYRNLRNLKLWRDS